MVKHKVVEEVEEEEEEELTFGDRVRRVVRKIVALLFLIPFVAFLILVAFRTASFAREFTTRQDAAPGTGRFVKAADLELFVQEAGPDTAPVVVFVHGTGAWSEIWRETMNTLADRGFRSVAIDLPPFGFSERPEAAAYDNASQARRILGVLDALALDSVILVGHSFGARPTMEATFMAPQRIRRLVLVDAALGVGEGATEPPPSRLTRTVLAIAPLRNALVSATATNPMMTRRLFQKLIYNDAAATDARVNMLQKPFLVKGSTGKLGQWLRWFLAPTEPSLASERERYRTLPMPVLLIWGERDDLTPLPQGEDLASIIPRAELVVLKNTGHIPAVEDPAAFNAALIQFLEAPR